MDPFWGITLSFLALRSVWKERRRKLELRKQVKEEYEGEDTVTRLGRMDNEFREERIRNKTSKERQREVERLDKEAKRRKQKDIQDLKDQGFTDELIAVILPTINNGQ